MVARCRALLLIGIACACAPVSVLGQPRPICSVCDSSGTITTRLRPPGDFERQEALPGSFADWLRKLPLLPEGADATDWLGRLALAAEDIGAVIDWRLLGRVEQCADVGVRLVAEYAYGNGNADEIVFRSLSGQRIEWKKWLQGRYSVNGDASAIIYNAGAARMETPREFDAYVTFVMSYVNTASLKHDWQEVAPGDVQIGDVLIQPSCPGTGMGHMSMVVDACEDSAGNRLYLFIDGYTPARLPVVRQREPNNPDSAWMTPKAYLEYMDQFGPGDFYRSPDWATAGGQ